MTGCMRKSLLFESFGSLEYFRKILSKEKERKEHDKKTEHLIEGKHRDRGVICYRTGFKCHAHYGGIPSGSILHCVGSHLPAVYRRRIFSIQKTLKQSRKTLILLAMSGAFVFVISSLKIPSVTGSCSHMTGTGLGAILFGPTAAGVLGLIVLLFQAILLAHGGLTTLGANTFSMAIAGPFLSYGIYKLCQKLNVNRKVAVFLAAFFGDLFTYCVTSLQLAMAYPSEAGGVGASAVKFLGVFAPTQLPLAVMEGLLTVVIVIALESYAKPELKAVGFLKEEK